MGRQVNLKRRRVLAACSLLVMLPMPAWPVPPAPFVMGIDHEETSFGGQWIRRIYVEAFRRLEIPLRFAVYPTSRLSAMVDRGDVDGEVQRAPDYAAAHPDLVRVDEPVTEGRFVLVVADPAARLDRIEDLPAGHWRGQYRRGVLVCEKALRQWQSPDRLFDVTSTEQGLTNLLEGPPRFFHCDTELALSSALYSARFKGVTAIRKLLVLKERVPLYPYLHRRNAGLAPRLAAVLRQIKAEGLVTRLRRDVEREFTAR